MTLTTIHVRLKNTSVVRCVRGSGEGKSFQHKHCVVCERIRRRKKLPTQALCGVLGDQEKEEDSNTSTVWCVRGSGEGRSFQHKHCVVCEGIRSRKKLPTQALCGVGVDQEKEEASNINVVWCVRGSGEGRSFQYKHCVVCERIRRRKKVPTQTLCGV